MKVRSYLLSMTGLILMPVILFSGLSLGKLHDAHHQSSEQRQKEVARSVALAIDQELISAKSALRVLAASRFLENEDYRSFYEQARVANIGDTGWIILYDENGDQLVSTRVAYGTPIKTTRDRKDILAVLQQAQVTASNLFFGKAVGHHVVMLEMPVVLPSGRKFVLSQAFLPAHFQRAFGEHGASREALLGIFDRDGVIVARSRLAERYVGRPVIATMREAMLAEHEGVLRHKTSDGVEVYDVFTRSRISGWVVAVGAPVALIEAEVHHAVRLWIGGLIFSALFAAALAAYIGRRMVRSIGATADAAALLGRGGQPVTAASSGVAEVDRLNAALQDAGRLLAAERVSRAAAEAEREHLLDAEKRARLAAEELNQAKDRFLAMLSHELRNPLNAITAAVSVFDLNPGQEAMSRAVGVVRRQGAHLRHIVDDLLDVSRALSGRLSLKRQRIDLGRAAADAVAALQSAGRTAHHRLALSVSPAWVDADPVRMDQVITNLLDNALKYTPHGGLIQLELHAVGDKAVLTIRDDGIGIAPGLLPKVFEVFVQADHSLDRARGGLGIGLSLVRELVRLHGGAIDAHSDGLGRGSVFTVTLPSVATPPPDLPAATEARPDAARSASVLLIEDNADARELFALMLSSSGCRVLQADNGAAGLRLAAEAQPQIAFIDIGLPDMDGYQIARRLRENPHTRHMVLVALSGYGTAEDMRQSAQAGFDRHLVKPVRLNDLMETIDALT